MDAGSRRDVSPCGTSGATWRRTSLAARCLWSRSSDSRPWEIVKRVYLARSAACEGTRRRRDGRGRTKRVASRQFAPHHIAPSPVVSVVTAAASYLSYSSAFVRDSSCTKRARRPTAWETAPSPPQKVRTLRNPRALAPSVPWHRPGYVFNRSRSILNALAATLRPPLSVQSLLRPSRLPDRLLVPASRRRRISSSVDNARRRPTTFVATSPSRCWRIPLRRTSRN